jgi:PAS domain S-box-containing protein
MPKTMPMTPMLDTSAQSAALAGKAGPEPFDLLPVPYLQCDAQGIIDHINEAARNLVYVHGFNFLGKAIWTLVAPDQQQMSHDSFCALMENGGDPPTIRRAIYTPNGGFRTYELHRSMVHDAEGRPAGLRMLLFDITEQIIELEWEKRARLWLESISDSLAEAVIVTDALGFIRFVNAAAEHLTEWQASELVRMTIAKAVPILSYSRADGVPFNYRLVLERHSSGIITFLSKNKLQVTVAFSTAPVLDKLKESTIGVSYVFRKLDLPG